MGNRFQRRGAARFHYKTYKASGAALTAGIAVLLCFSAGAQTGMTQTPTAEVQTIATERTGFCVMPSGNPQADDTISYAINCMLSEPLTKDEAVQIALLNNRNLQARLADLGIAYGDMIEAGLLKNPILEFLYRKSDAPMTVANIEWSVTLDFINVLTLPLRRCIAESEFEATKLEVANDVLDLAFDVQTAYYNMQAAIQMGAMYRGAVETSEAAYNGAKMMHEAGNISDLELHREQIIYEEQKLNLAEAEREIIELREQLNMLMGLWGACTEWAMPDELPDMPRREFQGRGLESIAVYQRLDLAAARQEIETVARELGLENATRLLPELEGIYSAERETDGSWLRGGGASLPVPIFNQGQGRVQKQRARLLRAQHRYYALAVEIRSEVRKAFGQMRKSRDRVRYFNSIMLPLLERVVEESHLQFNAMDVSTFELLEAKRDEILGRRDRVEALKEYWVARSELERAMGGCFYAYEQPREQLASGSAQTAAAAASTKVQGQGNMQFDGEDGSAGHGDASGMNGAGAQGEAGAAGSSAAAGASGGAGGAS